MLSSSDCCRIEIEYDIWTGTVLTAGNILARDRLDIGVGSTTVVVHANTDTISLIDAIHKQGGHQSVSLSGSKK